MKSEQNQQYDKYKECMIEVTDNWCPCYPSGTVKLSIRLIPPGSGEDEYCVKVAAWGMDDFGVEMEYITNDYPSAVDRFEFWDKWIFSKVPNGVSVEWFYEHGFVNF